MWRGTPFRWRATPVLGAHVGTCQMTLTRRFVRPDATSPPLSPHAAAVDRLRRAFNAVRDAQEMLERLARTGPMAVRATVATPLEDLEWTAAELSTALTLLQASAPPSKS
jgi:hypothetical protein